jgi:CDP-diacylglycerol--serine O-phosphatidyltransferase
VTKAPLRRRLRRPRFRVRAVSGAEVVSLRQISPRERIRVTLPSMITSANLACGFSGVLLAFNEQFFEAALLMTLSIVFDIADGAVARAVGATSPFGIQLDSMADLISFGLAPAVLVYTWVLPERPVIAWLAAFLWLACAAFRLARFNFTVDPLDDKRYFIGLPSPGAAAVVLSTVMALDSPGTQQGTSLIYPAAVGVVPALLMVSTVRFRSFRNLLSPKTPQARVVTAVLGIAVVVGLVLDAPVTLMVLAYSYVLTAPLGVLTAPLRKRIFGPDSVAPERPVLTSVFLAQDLDDTADAEA